ncbi:MAG: FixH family protein [Ktedonobacteraceae bacterium]|nr:FixH family protein [Ktedonobacteraceae bacterium]
MIFLRLASLARRTVLLALPLALALLLLFPAASEAQAILIKSDPAQNAVLATSPAQVHLWFSEDLNPATSRAYVTNSAGQRVDVNGSLIIPGTTRELDIALKPDLPPDVYIVSWRTQSAADGHVLSNSFVFYLAAPDGSVPQLKGPLPTQNALGNSSAAANGQFDIPTLFSFIMIALVDLGTIFWVGAQLWRTFVLETSEEERAEQQAVERDVIQRFDHRFAQPILRVLFFANLGVLLGQSLAITGGRWDQVFSSVLFFHLIANGRFGLFWVIREVIIVLAMILAVYSVLSNKRSRIINSLISWTNLILALALLIAVTFSGSAAGVTGRLGIFAVLADWLHLLAASLWIGGILYVALVCLPVLKDLPAVEQAHSLLTMLARFFPLALVGVIIMATTGPFSAAIQMFNWQQLFLTAYGRALIVKILLVLGLLIIEAVHLGYLRPRLLKNYMKYQGKGDGPPASSLPDAHSISDTEKEVDLIAPVRKVFERRITRQTSRLASVLRLESLLGVSIVICTGLMTVFSGTLAPIPPAAPAQSVQVKPFITSVKTLDGKFTVKLTISPNRFGPNIFTVNVQDDKGQPVSNASVSAFTTHLDMDMGTDKLDLQPDGKGNFTGNGMLSMPGHWQIRILIRTADNTPHEARVEWFTAQ